MPNRFALKRMLICVLAFVALCGGIAVPTLVADDLKTASGSGSVPSVVPPKKTMGIIGGVSWVSSAEYYRLANEMVQDRLGGLNSAKILMFSIDFEEFSRQERLAGQGDWAPLRKTMIDAARRLKSGGADFIVIASNTMNSSAGEIQKTVGIPVIHIADATGKRVAESGIKTVLLLGTKYTMESDFYRSILEGKYGLKVVVPGLADRDYINAVIFDELCAARFHPESKERFRRIIEDVVGSSGAEGVILGCTEIPLLIKQEDVSVPVFDTTEIHIRAAVDYSLRAD